MKECGLCSKKYQTKKKLESHIRKIHGEYFVNVYIIKPGMLLKGFDEIILES